MAWYTILFITISVLFIVKFILSWVGGDFEMDVDLDGVDDFDASGAFSFKGLVHFLLGFSSYLYLKSHMIEIYKVNGIAQFGIFDYIMAIIAGMVLMLILFYAYRFVIKANSTPKNPIELVNNCKGKIYINLGNGQYSVEAHTLAGTTNVTAFYTGDELEPGTEVTLIKEGNDILINKIDA